jgi:hypothetical protein
MIPAAAGAVNAPIYSLGGFNGLLSPLLFTVMALMALITTGMTAPLLDLIAPPTLSPAPHLRGSDIPA